MAKLCIESDIDSEDHAITIGIKGATAGLPKEKKEKRRKKKDREERGKEMSHKPKKRIRIIFQLIKKIVSTNLVRKLVAKSFFH